MIEYKMKNSDDIIQVGFIFSYPPSKTEKGNSVKEMMSQLNHLLCKLNRKYQQLFPNCNYNCYPITYAYLNSLQINGGIDLKLISQESNLDRIKEDIKNLNIIICFGEKAHFAVKRVIELYNLNVRIIKVKNIHQPYCRSIKRLDSKANVRVRSNFKVLDIYNEIDKQLNI